MLLIDQNKVTIGFQEQTGAASHITSLKNHLAMVLWLLSTKNKNNLLHLQIQELENPWCLLGITLFDSTFYDSLSQWPNTCKHLSTAEQKQKQASTEDAVCVLLNHSQAPLPSLWEKSGKGHCLSTTPKGNPWLWCYSSEQGMWETNRKTSTTTLQIN